MTGKFGVLVRRKSTRIVISCDFELLYLRNRASGVVFVQSINQSINQFFAIEGHGRLTYHTNSTIITTNGMENGATLRFCGYMQSVVTSVIMSLCLYYVGLFLTLTFNISVGLFLNCGLSIFQ